MKNGSGSGTLSTPSSLPGPGRPPHAADLLEELRAEVVLKVVELLEVFPTPVVLIPALDRRLDFLSCFFKFSCCLLKTAPVLLAVEYMALRHCGVPLALAGGGGLPVVPLEPGTDPPLEQAGAGCR